MAGTDHNFARKLLDRESYAVKRAFYVFVHDLKHPAMLNLIVAHMRRHDINGAVKVMDRPLREFARSLSRSFLRAAHEEASRIRSQVRLRKIRKAPPREAVTFSFDPGDSTAADIMASSELRLIKDFTDDQRATVRSALTDALNRGLNPSKAARLFRDAIGLSSTQYAAVANYRRLLEGGSSEALGRGLRDARYDRTLSAALSRGDVLSDSQIDTMVGRYADNMLALRADTIARTESHRALSQGRFQALSQLADRYDIPADNITRTWNATQDARTRDTHAEMDGQQVGGFEPFVSPSGATLMHPGDPSAPPEETINCRCVETYEVA